MTPLIRPEAKATLNRLREVLAGLLMIGMGAYLLFRPGYMLPVIGMALGLLGAGLAVIGLRQLWFRAEGQGPGVVKTVEGQIAYFGPDGGGFLALDDMTALELTAGGGAWRLTGADGTVLEIPRDAAGAEALLDAFVRLPGLDPAAVVRAASGAASGTRPGHHQRLWQRGAPARSLPRS